MNWLRRHGLIPADPRWWFSAPPGRPGDWWRGHVVAHVGHGALFCVAWTLIGVGEPWLAALATAVFWEAWQRETWPDFPLVENIWDVILAADGIMLTWLLLGRV